MGANIVMTSTAPPSPGLVANNAPLGATSLPSGPLTLSSDELSSLLPMFLGDNTGTLISFPTENFRENLSKDLAVHKYPNVNGKPPKFILDNINVLMLNGCSFVIPIKRLS